MAGGLGSPTLGKVGSRLITWGMAVLLVPLPIVAIWVDANSRYTKITPSSPRHDEIIRRAAVWTLVLAVAGITLGVLSFCPTKRSPIGGDLPWWRGAWSPYGPCSRLPKASTSRHERPSRPSALLRA